MTAGIQRSGLNESTYERPQQDWVCGWAAEGKPCRHGPNTKGVCVAAFECTPSERNGRWHCSRQRVHGGRCEDGPRPDGSCCKTDTQMPAGVELARTPGKADEMDPGADPGSAYCLRRLAGSQGSLPGTAQRQTQHRGRRLRVMPLLRPRAIFQVARGSALGTVSNAGESSLCTVCHDRGEHPFPATFDGSRASGGLDQTDPRIHQHRNHSDKTALEQHQGQCSGAARKRARMRQLSR